MSGLPYGKFYWNDWAGDPLLRTCSFAAQGYWMRLLCLAAESAEPGFVLLNGKVPKIEELILVTGGAPGEVEMLIGELLQKGVCSLDRRRAIYSRRMVKEAKKRTSSSKGGKIGGRVTLENEMGIHGTRGGTRSPYGKPESRVQNPESRIENAVDRFCHEVGIEHDPSGNQSNWQEILEKMVRDDQLDFELDILGAVQVIRAQGRLPDTLRTPAFFRSEAKTLAQARASGKPKATVHVIGPKAEDMTRGDWANRLRRFLECGIWIGPGPDPTCLGCIAPPDLLAGCRAKWQAQGNHPEYADTDLNFAWRPEGQGMRGVIWGKAKPVEAEQAREA